MTQPRTSTVRLPTHEAGLLVHAWTFRSENYFLPLDLRVPNAAGTVRPQDHGDAAGEYARFFETGLDGVFSDHPETGVTVRNRLFP